MRKVLIIIIVEIFFCNLSYSQNNDSLKINLLDKDYNILLKIDKSNIIIDFDSNRLFIIKDFKKTFFNNTYNDLVMGILSIELKGETNYIYIMSALSSWLPTKYPFITIFNKDHEIFEEYYKIEFPSQNAKSKFIKLKKLFLNNK